MAIVINHKQHNDYLEIIVTGTYDMGGAINKFQQLLDICLLTKLAKVLIDYRQLQGDGGGVEKILYALEVEELYLKYLKTGGQELQIAYLAPSIHTYEPGAETGKKIDVLELELFDNKSKALEWLGINGR